MKKKSFILSMLMVVIVLIAGGCAREKTESTTAKAKPKEAILLNVQDSEEEVKVPQKPKKVIVFDNGSLDTLDALGVGDSVIGAPIKNLPKYLTTYQGVESVGGIKEPDLEKINQLQPDLIVISGRQKDFKEKLSQIAPTIYLSVDGKNIWSSTKQNIHTLAEIFGKQKVAEDKIAELEEDIVKFKTQATNSDQSALVTLVSEGQLSAYGQGSRFGIIHDVFGFKQADDSIEASTHGQTISYEYLLEKNPDILFVVDRTKAIGGDDSQNNLAANELVKQTTAGKKQKVITLQPDVWYLSGGGLESTRLMLEDVQKSLE